MELAQQAINSFHALLDAFGCPHPNMSATTKLRDYSGDPWSFKLHGKSCYTISSRRGDIIYRLRKDRVRRYYYDNYSMFECVYISYGQATHFYYIYDHNDVIHPS